MHLQPAAKEFGYSRGDFPIAEMLAAKCVSLPVHEFISGQDVQYMADCVNSFYA